MTQPIASAHACKTAASQPPPWAQSKCRATPPKTNPVHLRSEQISCFSAQSKFRVSPLRLPVLGSLFRVPRLCNDVQHLGASQHTTRLSLCPTALLHNPLPSTTYFNTLLTCSSMPPQPRGTLSYPPNRLDTDHAYVLRYLCEHQRGLPRCLRPAEEASKRRVVAPHIQCHYEFIWRPRHGCNRQNVTTDPSSSIPSSHQHTTSHRALRIETSTEDRDRLYADARIAFKVNTMYKAPVSVEPPPTLVTMPI